MKAFVAIPAYDGKITIQTVRSLLNEQAAAALTGTELRWGLLPGGSLITTARDQAVGDFLASDCDKLVFVDADVSWEPGSLLKLISHPVDLVGGCYRHKQDVETYPLTFLDKPELWADPDTGLLEVSALPAGFLSITRAVFDKFRATHSSRAYTHFGQGMFGYFWAPPGSGEDGMFCHEWRQMGGQVWLDPTLTLGHTGGFKTYSGNVGDWLRSR